MKKICFSLILIMQVSAFELYASVNASIALSIMTFNIENGGTQVNFNQVVKSIQKAGADVVGLQEAWGNTSRLAKALGWHYFNGKQQIISRFPLYESKQQNALTFIEVQPHKFVALANMHLPDTNYSPYLIPHYHSSKAIEHNEKKSRLSTALVYIKALNSLKNDPIPVFLTGDFNSGSHLDWDQETVRVLPNHSFPIRWPITYLLDQQGFKDSYRVAYPNPVKDPGYTWPASRPKVKNSSDNYNPGPQDLPIRLDFIFTRGPSKVLSSQIVGERNKTELNLDPWPSDHRALVSQFEVKPAPIALNTLHKIIPMAVKKGKIRVRPKKILSGKPFTISWQDASAQRYDYIRIIAKNSKKIGWGEAVRLYTFARENGSIVYGKSNAQGNWLAWHLAEQGHWPLSPGVYTISLLLDDGFTVLAQTELTVEK